MSTTTALVEQARIELWRFERLRAAHCPTATAMTLARELDADLVVLSACQTGLGKATSGEGMLGSTQALTQKGARSVLLSRCA